MIRALQRLFYPQPTSQPQPPANTSVKKPVSCKPLTDEKIQQLYKQAVDDIIKAKGVTREVAEAEVNTLW